MVVQQNIVVVLVVVVVVVLLLYKIAILHQTIVGRANKEISGSIKKWEYSFPIQFASNKESTW